MIFRFAGPANPVGIGSSSVFWRCGGPDRGVPPSLLVVRTIFSLQFIASEGKKTVSEPHSQAFASA